jgi:hypothetical protein
VAYLQTRGKFLWSRRAAEISAGKMKRKEGAAESLPSKAQVHRGSEGNYGGSQRIYMPHPGMAKDAVAFLKTPKWKR